MRKYINDEILKAQQALINANDIDTASKALETFNELNLIALDLKTKKYNIRDKKSLLNLSTGKPQEDFITFAIDLLEIYATTPLLETESLEDYPTLSSDISINENDIIEFVNELYNQNILSQDNFITFNGKKFSLNNGRCIVYPNALQSKKLMLLERFHTAKDLTASASRAIEMTSAYHDFNNLTNIIRYYMKMNAIIELNNLPYYRDEASKLFKLEIDNLVFEARKIKVSIEKEGLNTKTIAFLYDFVDNVIGDYLANYNIIDIHKLSDLLMQQAEDINLTSLNTTSEKVLEGSDKIKEMVKTRNYII